MKLLLCFLCPLLTSLYFVISEIDEINEPLMSHTLADKLYQNDRDFDNDFTAFFESAREAPVYSLVFAVISVLYIIFLFTATYIGILIIKSLNFFSSLPPKTLMIQYVISIIVTFIMQMQFVILLLVFNLNDSHIKEHRHGLEIAAPFYMFLIYIEFAIASVISHFAFRNLDFIKFGKESIKKNEVQLFDFQPDFNVIHDLHNYRRVYGQTFLYEIDAAKAKKRGLRHKQSHNRQIDNDENYDSADSVDHNDDNQQKRERHKKDELVKDNTHRSSTGGGSKRKTPIRPTPLITTTGIMITVDDPSRPPSAHNARKMSASNKNKRKFSSKSLRKKSSKSQILKESAESPNSSTATMSKKELKMIMKTQTEINKSKSRSNHSIELEDVIDDDNQSAGRLTPQSLHTMNKKMNFGVSPNNLKESTNEIVLSPIIDSADVQQLTSTAKHVITPIDDLMGNDGNNDTNVAQNGGNEVDNGRATTELPSNAPNVATNTSNNSLTLSHNKETGHHQPNTTPSLSLEMVVDELAHYKAPDLEQETSVADDSWNESDDDASSVSLEKKKKQKHKKNKSSKKKVKFKSQSKSKSRSKSKAKKMAKDSNSNMNMQELNVNVISDSQSSPKLEEMLRKQKTEEP